MKITTNTQSNMVYVTHLLLSYNYNLNLRQNLRKFRIFVYLEIPFFRRVDILYRGMGFNMILKGDH